MLADFVFATACATLASLCVSLFFPSLAPRLHRRDDDSK